MSPHQRLAAISRRNLGVLSPDDLTEAGFSAHQIRLLVARGMLAHTDRGAYLLAGCPPTWHQSVMLAVTAAGPAALASHQTAAFLHGLVDEQPEEVEVVMPRWDRSLRGFVVHESTDLTPEDRALVGPIPTTAAARTVVDLGASARHLVGRALDRGLRTGAFTLGDVAGVVARVGRRGRRGVGVIRPLLAERLRWAGIAESDLEDLFRRVWARADREQPIAQWVIADEAGRFVCRSDFAFPAARLRIELDSEAFHMDQSSFRRDRAVQNRTELLGWRTLRYTWWDLTTRGNGVVMEICRALDAPRPSVLA
jgi:very-short-patch-repair endonuclease